MEIFQAHFLKNTTWLLTIMSDNREESIVDLETMFARALGCLLIVYAGVVCFLIYWVFKKWFFKKDEKNV